MMRKLEADAKEQREAVSVSEIVPTPITSIENIGCLLGFYGETGTGKSSAYASLPYLQEKYVDEWKDIGPNVARLLEEGILPEVKKGSIGVIDLDRKWGAYLGKGPWRTKGFTQFFTDGYYKLYQMLVPGKGESWEKKGVKIPDSAKADLESSKKYFDAVLDKLLKDPDVDYIVVDPLSEYFNLCTRRFNAMMNKVMPSLSKSLVDPGDGLRQSHFALRNQWFHDKIEQIRESGKWAFLGFNCARIPPQYQKDPKPGDIFNSAVFKVSWTNKTPEKIDQITRLYRVPNAKDQTKDKYYWQYKKGVFKPSETQFLMPDSKFHAIYYLESIAKSLLGEKE